MTRSNIVKCKTQEEKQQIHQMWEDSLYESKKEIARVFKISTRTLNRILNEMSTSSIVVWDFTVTKNEITVICNGEARSVSKGYPKFNKLKQTLIDANFSDNKLAEVYQLLDLASFVETFSEGNLTVNHEEGKVFYGSFEIKNVLTDRMMGMLSNQEDVKPLVRFLDKLLMNPKKGVVEELYPFLKHNDIEISEAGDIIGYRGIRPDWKDCHTGKMDNSVGKVLTIPRHMVDDDPDITCSSGLHVAALAYASDFSGTGRLVKVKVCPSDVVSIPTDYNGMKMRCCKFEVLSEVER
jgi:hypothetical protein